MRWFSKLKKVSPRGGSGGKRGHSAMEHWARTAEVKEGARHQRRREDDAAVAEQIGDLNEPHE